MTLPLIFGDACLQHVVRAIADETRSGDWLGRWGGDAVRTRAPAADLSCAITLSVGDVRRDRDRDPDEALATADAALSAVKRDSGDAVRIDALTGSDAHT